jgi:hypothetical protein
MDTNFYGLSTGGAQGATRPTAPTVFAVTQLANTTMTLGWTETASVFTNYSIERSLSASSGFAVITTGFPTLPLGAVTITDTGLTKNTRYYYRFRVFYRTKWSDYQTGNEITTNV